MAVIKNNRILKCLLMMVVSLLLVLNFSIWVSASTNYDSQEADARITISEKLSVKGGSKSAKTIPQQLTQEGKTPAIGKMKDLNTDGNVLDGEFKIADYLPDKGNPKANWKQNSGILRSVMNENVPIKDVSPFPMENAGFLGAERNLLQSRGWIYRDGYWYPPSN